MGRFNEAEARAPRMLRSALRLRAEESISFNEAEARAPRMLPELDGWWAEAYTPRMRPRRARLGCCLPPVVVLAPVVRVIMRPRRARLGCCLRRRSQRNDGAITQRPRRARLGCCLEPRQCSA